MNCPDCNANNLIGALVCEQCGADLYEALLERVATGQLASSSARDLPAVGVSPSSNPVVVYISGSEAPLALERRAGLVIGRGTREEGIDVDMTAYGGQDLGVSRRHARFDAHSDPPTITDLDSVNGTFVNEVRLPANQAVVLRSGDEVRLGRMVLRVYFK